MKRTCRRDGARQGHRVSGRRHPARPPAAGGREHPVQLVRRRVESIFLRMGYDVEDGPEVEDDWHNFEALNIRPTTRPRRPGHLLPAGRTAAAHAHLAGPARVMERRQRRSGSSCPAGSTGATRTSATRRCFIRWRGWSSTRNHLRPPQGDPRDLPARALLRAGGGAAAARLLPLHRAFGRGRHQLHLLRPGRVRRLLALGWIEILGSGMVDPRSSRRSASTPSATLASPSGSARSRRHAGPRHPRPAPDVRGRPAPDEAVRMKFDLDWLCELVDRAPDPDTVAERLTACGFLVELRERGRTARSGRSRSRPTGRTP